MADGSVSSLSLSRLFALAPVLRVAREADKRPPTDPRGADAKGRPEDVERDTAPRITAAAASELLVRPGADAVPRRGHITAAVCSHAQSGLEHIMLRIEWDQVPLGVSAGDGGAARTATLEGLPLLRVVPWFPVLRPAHDAARLTSNGDAQGVDKRILCVDLHPEGQWLLCLTKDGSIYVVPLLGAVTGATNVRAAPTFRAQRSRSMHMWAGVARRRAV